MGGGDRGERNVCFVGLGLPMKLGTGRRPRTTKGMIRGRKRTKIVVENFNRRALVFLPAVGKL